MNNAFFKNLFNMLCGKPSADDLANCDKLTQLTGLNWTPVYSMGPDVIFRTNDQADEETVSWRMKILNGHLFHCENVFKHGVIFTAVDTPTWRSGGRLRESDHYLFISKIDFCNRAITPTLLPTPEPGQTLRTYAP